MQATNILNNPQTGIDYDETRAIPAVDLYEIDGVCFAVQMRHTHFPLTQLALQRLELVAKNTPESELQAWTDAMVAKVKSCKAHMECQEHTSQGSALAKDYMIQEDEQLQQFLTGSKVKRDNPSCTQRYFSTYNNCFTQHGPTVAAKGDTPVLCHSLHSNLDLHGTLLALHQMKALTTDGYQRALIASIKDIQVCQLAALEGQIKTLNNGLAPQQLMCVVPKNPQANANELQERFKLLFDCYKKMISDDRLLINQLSESLRKL